MQQPEQSNVRASALQHAEEIKQVEQTTCCIVGGGPGGVMLAYLLARQGIAVTLLEAHIDFDRDFRGDTIHPSTLNILDELGLAERLLGIRHTRVHQLNVQLGNGGVVLADFSRLKTKYPFIALLPQVDFLNFMVEEARHYPSFRLIMGAQVDELVEEGGKVCGVRYRGVDGRYELRALLTIGADGRFSRLRKLVGFEPIKTSPPMDVLWFRLSVRPDDPKEPFGRVVSSRIVLMLNRFEYIQAGCVIPKGGYQEIRAAGLEKFRQQVAQTVPMVADRMHEIKEWKQVAVLSVEANRLPRWYKPGLLLIGDAAHVMSPVAGVGINYAIQDAVVASNLLASKLKYGVVELRDLAKVQRQRELPTRVIQAIQTFIQNRVLARVLVAKPPAVPLLLRPLLRVPAIRNLPARIIGIGFRPSHIKELTLAH